MCVIYGSRGLRFEIFIRGTPLPRLSVQQISIMKVLVGVVALIASAASASAFDISVFGERAVQNLNLTPACAQMCILNPKWAKEYAPECANIDLGVEYGTRLCQNYVYQHMLDNCFKEKCKAKDRKRVTLLLLFRAKMHRQGNLGKTLARVMESTWNCLLGKSG